MTFMTISFSYNFIFLMNPTAVNIVTKTEGSMSYHILIQSSSRLRNLFCRDLLLDFLNGLLLCRLTLFLSSCYVLDVTILISGEIIYGYICVYQIGPRERTMSNFILE
jgi:hypothetical protein